MPTNRNGMGLLMATLFLTSCGDKPNEAKKDEGSVSAMGAMGALRDVATQAGKMSKKGSTSTVDFRALKAFLPTQAAGLTRKEATGEKEGAAQFSISTAVGTYSTADGSETIELSLIDGGGSAMTLGLAAWTLIDVDKETTDGYEKTTTMDGNKAYETYDKTRQDGELDVLVNQRFLVSIKGHGVGMERLKATLKAIDLAKLATLN